MFCDWRRSGDSDAHPHILHSQNEKKARHFLNAYAAERATGWEKYTPEVEGLLHMGVLNHTLM